MQPKNPIKVYYVGDKSGEDGRGVMTVATKVVGQQLHVGFAFCSPEDQFSRVISRQLASDRMNDPSQRYVTNFSGHSINDVRDLWNAYMYRDEKPQLWKDRVLINIAETRGLTFVDKAKSPARPCHKRLRNKVVVYVAGGTVQSAVATMPSAVDLVIFDVDNIQEREGWDSENIGNEWEKLIKNTHIIF